MAKKRNAVTRWMSMFFSLVLILSTFAPTVSAEELDAISINGENAVASEDDIMIEGAVPTMTDDSTIWSYLSIQMSTGGGTVTLTTGDGDIYQIAPETQEDGSVLVSVFDGEGTLIDQNEHEFGVPDYTLDTESGGIVTIDAQAPEGMSINQFQFMSGGPLTTPDEFVADKYSNFEYAMVMDNDALLYVTFNDADGIDLSEYSYDGDVLYASDIVEMEGPTMLPTETEEETFGSDDIVITEDTEAATEAAVETEGLTEELFETESDAIVETEPETAAEEIETEAVTEAETAAEDETEVLIEEETEETLGTDATVDDLYDQINEYDMDAYVDGDFSSGRLVLLSEDPEAVKDSENILASYGDMYLMQYESAEDAQAAYTYYADYAGLSVEPDFTLTGADRAGVSVQQADIDMVEGSNPLQGLADLMDAGTFDYSDHNVIAVLDSGMDEAANVVDRVSVIDDKLVGGHHGNEMLSYINKVNDRLSVVSVRVLNDKGFGTVSSLVAGLEYAMTQKVDVINLSLYAKSTLDTSVVADKIREAIAAGIVVVGAAGNDNADAKDYVPGCVDEAYIIGATTKTGSKLSFSNYGNTVDYYVKADSTSAAAAQFSALVLSVGLDGIANDCDNPIGVVFSNDYVWQNHTEFNADLQDAIDAVEPTIDVNGPRIALHYDFYDWEGIENVDLNTDTVNTQRLTSYLLREEGDYYVFYANPFNMAVDSVSPHVVVLNPGTPDNLFITEDTIYDADEGVVKIPKKYWDETLYPSDDINSAARMEFGVSASTDSEAYFHLVPEDQKMENTPEHFKAACSCSTGTNSSYAYCAAYNDGSGSIGSQYFGKVTDPKYVKILKGIPSGAKIAITGTATFSGNYWTVSITSAKYNNQDLGPNFHRSVRTNCCCCPCSCGDTGGMGLSGAFLLVTSNSISTSGGRARGRMNFWIAAKTSGSQNQGNNGYVDVDGLVLESSLNITLGKVAGTTDPACDITMLNGNPTGLYDVKSMAGAKYRLYSKKSDKAITSLTWTIGSNNKSDTVTLKSGDYDTLKTTYGANYYLKEIKAPSSDAYGGEGEKAHFIPYEDSYIKVWANGNVKLKGMPKVDESAKKAPSVDIALTVQDFIEGDPLEIFLYKQYPLDLKEKSQTAKELKKFETAMRKAGKDTKYTYTSTQKMDTATYNLSYWPVHSTTKSEAVANTTVDALVTWTFKVSSKKVDTYYKIKSGADLYVNYIDFRLLDSCISDVKPWLSLDKKYYAYAKGTYVLQEVSGPDGKDGSLAKFYFSFWNREFIPFKNSNLKHKDKLSASEVKALTKNGVPKNWDFSTGGIIYACTIKESAEDPSANIAVQKVAENPDGTTDLSNCVFNVINASGEAQEISFADDSTVTVPNGAVICQLVTDSSGKATTEGMGYNGDELLPGDCDSKTAYQVVEVATNGIMDPHTKPFTFYIEKDGSLTLKSGEWYDKKSGTLAYHTIKVPEGPAYAGLQVVKYDRLTKANVCSIPGGSLAGAEFAVVNASHAPIKWYANAGASERTVSIPSYEGPADYASIKAAWDAGTGSGKVTMWQNPNGTLVSGADGYARGPSNDCTPTGTYYIIETKAPEGYELNDSWVGQCDVRVTNTGKPQWCTAVTKVSTIPEDNETGTVTDKPLFGGLKLRKIDSDLREYYGQGNAVDVGGATYVVINNTGNQVYYVGTQTPKPSAGLDYKTCGWDMANAMSYFSGVISVTTMNKEQAAAVPEEPGYIDTGLTLPAGDYLVVERSASVGYNVNNTMIGHATVTPGELTWVSWFDTTTGVDYSPEVEGDTPEETYMNGIWVQKNDRESHDNQDKGDTDLSGVTFAVINASALPIETVDKNVVAPCGITLAQATAMWQAAKDSGTRCTLYDTLFDMCFDSPTHGQPDLLEKPYKKDVSPFVEVFVANPNDPKGRYGYARSGLRDLPYGEYFIIELIPPKGYLVDDQWVGYVNITEDNNVTAPRDPENAGCYEVQTVADLLNFVPES